MSLRPRSWLTWSLPAVGLPLLAAWWLGSNSLESRLTDEALKAAGADWVKVTAEGRDLKISGDAPSQKEIEAVIKSVAGVYGVRRADAGPGLKLAELAVPTIQSVTTNTAQPEIKGTWPEKIAKTLTVGLADKLFKLGIDKELSSDGSGNWTLKPPAALADGGYDVTAEVSDGDVRVVKSETPGKLVVDTLVPVAPTFAPIAVSAAPAAIAGTWAEGDASSLRVKVGDSYYELGKDDPLKSGTGKWTLTFAKPLAEGSYDIAVETADAAGNVANITVPKAILIDSKPPAAPTVDKIAGSKMPAAITGTWDEANADSLKVTIDSHDYLYRIFNGLTSKAGRWALAVPGGLADGAFDVKVETKDKAGNVAAVTVAKAVTIDSIAPAAPTVDVIVGAAAPKSLTGTWAEGDAKSLKVTVDGHVYEYRVFSGLSSRNGKWSLDLPGGMKDGVYPVTVETADATGNVASATVPAAIVIDSVPPASPTVDKYSGNNAAVKLTGSWPEGDAKSLAVTVDGHRYEFRVFNGLTSSNGTWTLAVPGGLADGTHDIAVEVRDAAGNAATDSSKDEIAIDTQGPAAPTVDVYSGNNASKISGSWPEGDAKSLAVTVDGHRYEFRVFNGLTSSNGKWTLAVPGGLADGPHDIAVEVRDAAGNAATDSSKDEIVIDTQAPAAPTVDIYSGNNASKISGTWPEGDAKSLAVTVDGHRYQFRTFNGLTSSNGRWSLAVPGGLADGSFDVAVEVADAAGNVASVTAKQAVTIDTRPPEAPSVDPVTATKSPDVLTGKWAEGDAKSLDVMIDNHTYRYRVFNGLTSSRGSWSLQLPEPLKEGSYDVTVETADASGNVSRTTAMAAVVIDAMPAVPTVQASAGNNPQPVIAGGWAESSGSTLKIAIAGKTYALGTDAALTSDGAGNWKLKPEPLADGTYDVIATVTDAAGTSVSDTSADEVVVDTMPPAVPTVTAGGRLPVSGTWAGGDAKSLKVTLDGTTYVWGDDPALSANGNAWSLSGTDPAPGTYDVVVETADQYGNVSRDATSGELTIAAPTPPATMAAPTVDKYAGNNPAPQITGTWDNGLAKSLSVAVGGKSYRLGTDSALSADGSKWTLSPGQLADGYYDVVATTADAAGQVARDATVAEVIVDTKAPAEPTVNAGGTSPITGTWAADDATSLKVTFDGKAYALGTDAALTADGGTWSLAVPQPGPGIYDVEVETADAFGNVSRDASTAEIYVPQPKEPPPPPPAVMTAPTVDKVAGNNPAPAITGTWDQKVAKSLAVAVAGKTYALGVDRQLTGADGKWQLVPEKLADGYYDVVATSIDAAGNALKDATVAEVIVDTKAPAEPTVNARGTSPITGTWAADDATSLRVTFDGKAYALGTDAALTAEGGNWSLAVPQPGPGIYDVEVETADAFGNVSRDASTAEIYVPQPKEPPPPPPAVMTAPTVDKVAGNNPAPAITGTWDDKVAKSLAVAVAGKTYALGVDRQLTGADGKWQLVPEKLADGYYDVVATSIDAAGNALKDATVAEVIVDTAGPAAPTVNAGAAMPITGSFAEGDSQSLKVSFNGTSYVLGKDSALTADGGNWSLVAPLPGPGIYDVEVETADRYGNLSTDASTAEFIIPQPPPPPPPPPPMMAPTVDRSAGNNPAPSITGTWDPAGAKSLTVAIAGKTYSLGADGPLKADGSKWSLVPEKLADGYYDVVATTVDAGGKALKDSTVAEVIVDTQGPAQPTVNAGAAMPVTGTFDPDDSKTLKVTFNGRSYALGQDAALTAKGGDWSLAGDQPGPGIYDVEVEVADSYGNVSSDASTAEFVVPQPPPPPPPPPPQAMAAPTVASQESLIARPIVAGTWSEGVAKDLRVELAGSAYVLGTDEALKSDGKGGWMLTVPKPLKDGTYDVVVQATGADGTVLSDTSKNELIVDAAGPAAPTVSLYSGEDSPKTISGTWAEGDAVSLAVMLNGITATLGIDAALSSDGKGRWTLAVPQILEPKSYDVVVSTADKRGRLATDQTKFEILVKQKPEPEPGPTTVPEPISAADCQTEFNAILIVNTIQFETDKAGLKPESFATVKRLAEIAQSCPEQKFEIAGHTDNVGSELYNQALSERRAVSVLKALADDGVDPARMTAKGYGETMPLASNDTPEGRAVNRRIELTILK